MYALLIDVVSNRSIVLIWSEKNNKLIGENIFLTENNSSEIIISQIEKVLKDHGIEYRDLSKIITVVGPGNYTSIRVGIAAAKGIGLASNIPTFGITQHELIAKSYKRNQNYDLIILVHAKNEDFYYQKFNNGMNLCDEIKILHFDDILDKITEKNCLVIETENAFVKLLLKNNKNLKNLVSNYHVSGVSMEIIFANIDKNTNKNIPKYIKSPNAKIHKKEKIYK
jgi:tRNA threonylcarbamoyl adenosine modification protein YeaZ|tara:strand:- start:1052 stop:1726 length:675 start_codon:yes stop_codon:yes gene_type:complete